MKTKNKIKISIVGGSGYAGGELLRLLLFHPEVTVSEVTSNRFAGKPVTGIKPNLRGFTELKFIRQEDLRPCDVLFLCLPHGQSMNQLPRFASLASRIVDLSADFRLRNAESYVTYYSKPHTSPELLKEFAYGIAEINRPELREADRIACAGCNATVTILSLYPLYHAGLVQTDRTVVEVKVGSSEGGNRGGEASHHPERSGCVRSYSPVLHRHVAEIEERLSFSEAARVHLSLTSIEMVRGALATCHVFVKEKLDERDLWRLYREYYGAEPFVRIVKGRQGIHRFPEPKLLMGTNFCDVGFEIDPRSDRLVIIGAIDNLMKGAAGQAVQALNLMFGFSETEGLAFPGLHPV